MRCTPAQEYGTARNLTVDIIEHCPWSMREPGFDFVLRSRQSLSPSSQQSLVYKPFLRSDSQTRKATGKIPDDSWTQASSKNPVRMHSSRHNTESIVFKSIESLNHAPAKSTRTDGSNKESKFLQLRPNSPAWKPLVGNRSGVYSRIVTSRPESPRGSHSSISELVSNQSIRSGMMVQSFQFPPSRSSRNSNSSVSSRQHNPDDYIQGAKMYNYHQQPQEIFPTKPPSRIPDRKPAQLTLRRLRLRKTYPPGTLRSCLKGREHSLERVRKNNKQVKFCPDVVLHLYDY